MITIHCVAYIVAYEGGNVLGWGEMSGGKCPGGKCPGGNVRGEMSGGGNVQGGNVRSPIGQIGWTWKGTWVSSINLEWEIDKVVVK